MVQTFLFAVKLLLKKFTLAKLWLHVEKSNKILIFTTKLVVLYLLCPKRFIFVIKVCTINF